MGFAALDKLTERNGNDALAEGVNTGGMFSTGSGRLVAVSERAIRRASALVGEEMEEATNSNRKKRAFAPECGLIWLNCCVFLDIWLLGTGTVYVHFSVPSKRLMSLSIAEQPFGDDAGLQGEQTN